MAQSKPFYYDNGIVNASPYTIDWNNGEVQRIEVDPLIAGLVINFANPLTKGSIYVLEIISNGLLVTFPLNVQWGAAGVPALSAVNADLLNFYYNGNNYYGTYALDFVA